MLGLPLGLILHACLPRYQVLTSRPQEYSSIGLGLRRAAPLHLGIVHWLHSLSPLFLPFRFLPSRARGPSPPPVISYQGSCPKSLNPRAKLSVFPRSPALRRNRESLRYSAMHIAPRQGVTCFRPPLRLHPFFLTTTPRSETVCETRRTMTWLEDTKNNTRMCHSLQADKLRSRQRK